MLAATDTFVNVIARAGAGGHDLDAESDGIGRHHFDVTDSNYGRPSRRRGPPARHTSWATPPIRARRPLFADATNGDFHEILGSPTINAGVNDAANGT